MDVVRNVRVFNAGKEIPVQGRINCKTVGFLYLLWSEKNPEKQYLDRCGHSVAARLREHRNSIIKKIRGKAVPDHFLSLRSMVDDLKFVPFMKIRNKNPHILIAYEKHLINCYNLVASSINLIL